MDEEKKKAPFESGHTPGMLKNPFGTPDTQQAKKTGLQKSLKRGRTPGMLTDPFNRHRKKPQTPYKPPVAPVTTTKPAPKPTRVIYQEPEPFWYQLSKYMFDAVRAEKNLSDDQIEWIKKVAHFVPDILVKVPSYEGISTEDVEVAIFLESIENLHYIIDTKAAKFDPVRQWNRNFGQLSKVQRGQFWTRLAQTILEKLNQEAK